MKKYYSSIRPIKPEPTRSDVFRLFIQLLSVFVVCVLIFGGSTIINYLMSLIY